MKHRRHLWFTLLISLSTVLSWPVIALSDDQVDPAATKKELKRLQKRIHDLQDHIKRKQSQRSQAEQALSQTEKQVSQIKSRLHRVSDQLTQTERKLSRLNQTQTILLKAKNEQKSALAKDISRAYRAGRQEYLKLILNQEEPDRLARQLKYYDYFHKARMKRIVAFNGTLDELHRNQTAIQQQQAEQKILKKELKQQETQLEKAKAQRHSALAQVEAELNDQSKKMEQLKQDQTELEKVLHAVQESLADLPSNMGGNPFGEQKGKLVWPVKGPLVTVFGHKKPGSELRWNGVVIAVPEGSEVKAVHPGRIVFADWMRSYGNIIIIDHGSGFLSLYGYNESLLKSPGDWVSNREVIAYAGNSGGRTRSGLYFELRKGGIPIDPAGWCKKE